MITLTINDVLTRLTKDELDELTTANVEAGQADPMQKALDQALAEINLFINATTLADDLLYRLQLSLAIPLMYPRRIPMPDRHKDEQSWARDILTRLSKGEISAANFTVVRQPVQPATRCKMEGLT
jgi:hypothetical protein